MEKYVTLVFECKDEDSLKKIRGYASNDSCVAWSLDHEILRLELIEKSLDDNNIVKAKDYISASDVFQFRTEL